MDWPTYHRSADRGGLAAGIPPLGRLAAAWHTRLDGAVYGQPLVIGDTVVAATQNDTVYGLDLATGTVRWHQHVDTPVPLSDLPCGNIDPLGITGTPVYDPATRRVFALAEISGYDHVLVGLDVATGQVAVRRTIPTGGPARYQQQRPALALTAGRVYVAFGGLLGDCGPYRGSVVASSTSGQGPLLTYTVPSREKGAIWATGGPTVAADGTIYVSVGNGEATSSSDHYDGSDSVVALRSDLRQLGFFAPTTWAADNAGDLDLGSMSPALLPDGRVLIAGKRGTAYLLRAGAALGGIGGQLAAADVCPAFGGPAVDGTTAYLPCISGGLAAVSVAGDRIRVRWRGPDGTNGSPVIGGGAVWVVDWDAGRLYALDPSSGRERAHLDVGPLPHFASPTLAGDRVLLGTNDGVVAVAGG